MTALKRTVAVLAVLLGVLAFVPLSSIAEEGEEDKKLIYSDAILWKLDKEGSKDNYLLGTVHINDDRILDVPEPILKALKGSTTAAFEIITVGKTFGGGESTHPYFFTDGRSLRLVIGDEMWQRVKAIGRRKRHSQLFAVSDQAMGADMDSHAEGY